MGHVQSTDREQYQPAEFESFHLIELLPCVVDVKIFTANLFGGECRAHFNLPPTIDKLKEALIKSAERDFGAALVSSMT